MEETEAVSMALAIDQRINRIPEGLPIATRVPTPTIE